MLALAVAGSVVIRVVDRNAHDVTTTVRFLNEAENALEDPLGVGDAGRDKITNEAVNRAQELLPREGE